ncbi:response regulator transcription factor [Lentzea nigeriaca]|uniref:response regulator transcription factor n=1 Tax=Lentzea nigeriaca TaxID=1128665 RepID=UPI001957BAF0|nr:response regulator transcription factor [Lentzea nigeriaca]MBM7859152.1 DNA-binding NarL/FixJ family response regulator [Lentzea nigeriaca]
MISTMPARVLRVAVISSASSLERGVAPIIRESRELAWIGSASDSNSAIHLCRTDGPDVLLLDSASDPRWDLALLLTSMFPDLAIVGLLRRDARNSVAAAWARLHGVRGLIGLNADGEALLTTIRATVEKGQFVHPDAISSS